MPDRAAIKTYFMQLQDSICQQLEMADEEGRFQEDSWDRPDGGGGRSRVIQGKHIEKGGVNFSAVHGPMPDKIVQKLGVQAGEFFATGVSIVLHPRNPKVPIIHMNVRYFEMSDQTWWFGGGIDLTPHYIVTEDAQYFHQQLKLVCDAYHPTYYPRFKKWADDYFYLKHRDETRGVGGIFFDRLSDQDDFTRQQRFDYVKAVGELFAPLYIELLQRHQDEDYTSEEREWQLLRRGRYVEFNLVWDKGTKFGLDTGGRTESILMSMPPHAQWMYNYQPATNTPEGHTQSLLKKNIDWLHIETITDKGW